MPLKLSNVSKFSSSNYLRNDIESWVFMEGLKVTQPGCVAVLFKTILCNAAIDFQEWIPCLHHTLLPITNAQHGVIWKQNCQGIYLFLINFLLDIILQNRWICSSFIICFFIHDLREVRIFFYPSFITKMCGREMRSGKTIFWIDQNILFLNRLTRRMWSQRKLCWLP